jgi:acyl-CoA hydrolase
MKKTVQTRAGTLVTTQKIVAGEHLNPNGILFGGYLMCWMDEIAFMCARRFTGKPSCVTVNIDNITFKTPIKLGEHIHLSAQVNHVGTSSMEIEVKVERENPKTLVRTHTNNAHLTFVCLNKKHRPVEVPRLILETIEDQRKQQEAQIRSRVRKRLGRFLERKLSEDWNVSKPRTAKPANQSGYFAIKLPSDFSPQGINTWIKKRISILPGLSRSPKED